MRSKAIGRCVATGLAGVLGLVSLLTTVSCAGPDEGRSTHQPITGVDRPRDEVAPKERPGDRGDSSDESREP